MVPRIERRDFRAEDGLRDERERRAVVGGLQKEIPLADLPSHAHAVRLQPGVLLGVAADEVGPVLLVDRQGPALALSRREERPRAEARAGLEAAAPDVSRGD